MLSSLPLITVVVVFLALAFDFINGFHDTANVIATSVSTRVLTMKEAIVMCVALNFVGALLGEGVAKTIGKGIVNTNQVTQWVVISALIGAIIWNLITWYFGIPSSSSHALIGGLIGAAMAYTGTVGVVFWNNFFFKVVLWLVLSPVIGFIVGYILMNIMNFFLRDSKPTTVTKIFSKAQIVSAMAMALNHGMNDAQKCMGVITMALVSAQLLPADSGIPTWVKLACALAMAGGTACGGKKIIKTMGSNMARIAQVQGFAAQTGAAGVIFVASMLEAPVSTTHIITTSIMGVGAAKRFSSVRWGVVYNILWSWVITIPACAVVSGIISLIITKLV